MGFSFDRPIGAGADTLELEYVSALMQTNLNAIRMDGCLTAQDVALFLTSRYGVVITEKVAEQVFRGFSTAKEVLIEKDEDVALDGGDPTGDGGAPLLDLMEFVALLMIPRLRRIGTEQQGVEDDTKIAIAHIFEMLMHDTLGSEYRNDNTEQTGTSVVLTKPLMQRIFTSLGETNIANQDDLIQDMIDVVARFGGGQNSGREGEDVILTADSFTRAVSYDLLAYDPSSVNVLQTNFDDVSGFYTNDKNGGAKTKKAEDPDGDLEADTQSKEESAVSEVPVVPTLSWLDFAADTYRSRFLVVVAWLFFGFSFFTYYSGVGTFLNGDKCESFEYRGTWSANLAAFGCSIGWSIARWLYIVAVMGVYGIALHGLVGIGNGIEMKNPLLPLIGAVAAGAYTVVPLFIHAFDRGDVVIDRFLRTATTLFGFLVVSSNLWAAIVMSIPFVSGVDTRNQPWLTSGSVRAEAMVKKAGIKKTDAIFKNALKMHMGKDVESAIGSHYGQALLNFATRSNTETERIGGVRWTWKQIWNHNLFESEGLWFSARLLSINVAQYFLAIFILVAGIVLTMTITENYLPPVSPIQQAFELLFQLVPGLENLTAIIQTVSTGFSNFIVNNTPTELFGCPLNNSTLDNCNVNDYESCRISGESWLCALIHYTKLRGQEAAWDVQEGLLDRAGYPFEKFRNSTFDTLTETATESVNTLYPTEKYMLFIPLILGTLTAFATAITNAVAVIPSAATITLKLRSGIIDLMHDPMHAALRDPDDVAYLRGAMFWGTIFSSGLMGFIIALIWFLILYQNTASIAQRVIAAIIGIMIVAILQYLIFPTTSRAFYRRRPRFSNLILLVNECAYFALTISFTIIRVAKFIFATVIFVGRIDIPFLAPGIGELNLAGYHWKLDNHPYIFSMDIMQHEAHRHPYIEIFGVVSLLKLKHGKDFITKAGTGWRLLLVSMLMPWLSRYRRMARERLVQDSDGSKELILMYQDLRKTSGSDSNDTRDKDQVIQDLQGQVQSLRERLIISQATSQNERGKRSIIRKALEARS